MTTFLSGMSVTVTLPCLFILVFLCRRVYSVYFGPLSKFPGPKLAAATLWYEFYYDVVLRGQYTFKIKELHEEYGMSPATIHRTKLQLIGIHE